MGDDVNHTMLSVVCPYVKYIRFTVAVLSSLIAMIPTAEDMADSWTMVEPDGRNHQVSDLDLESGYERQTHEIFLDACFQAFRFVIAIEHAFNGFRCD